MFAIDEIRSLNEMEMMVFQYVMEHKTTVPYMRIRELADETHVSTTTILRFCKKMGCDGYTEFKIRMKEYLGQCQSKKLIENDEELRHFFEKRFPEQHFQEELDDAVSIMAKVERILFVGIGNSGHIAQYAARYFTNMGKFSLCINDPFYPIHTVQILSTLAVVFSVSGESLEILQLVKDLKKEHCPVISITSTSQCTLAKMSDVNLSYGISMSRGQKEIDYTTQVPSVYLLEILGKRVQNRLTEN